MIPRSQMVIIEDDFSLEQVLEVVITSQHSRFPVVGESSDDIKGILLAKEMLPLLLAEKAHLTCKSLLRPATIIPESKRLNVLLQEFREQRYHMAIVVDEYGGVSGLLTIEDILEEIVGEIEDETDEHEAGTDSPRSTDISPLKQSPKLMTLMNSLMLASPTTNSIRLADWSARLWPTAGTLMRPSLSTALDFKVSDWRQAQNHHSGSEKNHPMMRLARGQKFLRCLSRVRCCPCRWHPSISGRRHCLYGGAVSQLQYQSLKQALAKISVFGFGMFFAGVSWVYVSIHEHGFIPHRWHCWQPPYSACLSRFLLPCLSPSAH